MESTKPSMDFERRIENLAFNELTQYSLESYKSYSHFSVDNETSTNYQKDKSYKNLFDDFFGYIFSQNLYRNKSFERKGFEQINQDYNYYKDKLKYVFNQIQETHTTLQDIELKITAFHSFNNNLNNTIHTQLNKEELEKYSKQETQKEIDSYIEKNKNNNNLCDILEYIKRCLDHDKERMFNYRINDTLSYFLKKYNEIEYVFFSLVSGLMSYYSKKNEYTEATKIFSDFVTLSIKNTQDKDKMFEDIKNILHHFLIFKVINDNEREYAKSLINSFYNTCKTNGIEEDKIKDNIQELLNNIEKTIEDKASEKQESFNPFKVSIEKELEKPNPFSPEPVCLNPQNNPFKQPPQQNYQQWQPIQPVNINPQTAYQQNQYSYEAGQSQQYNQHQQQTQPVNINPQTAYQQNQHSYGAGQSSQYNYPPQQNYTNWQQTQSVYPNLQTTHQQNQYLGQSRQYNHLQQPCYQHWHKQQPTCPVVPDLSNHITNNCSVMSQQQMNNMLNSQSVANTPGIYWDK